MRPLDVAAPSVLARVPAAAVAAEGSCCRIMPAYTTRLRHTHTHTHVYKCIHTYIHACVHAVIHRYYRYIDILAISPRIATVP
jgi:hypothetical protein